jgi:hypothetical protein
MLFSYLLNYSVKNFTNRKEGEEKMRIVLRGGYGDSNECYSVVEEEGINNPFIDVYLAGDIVTPNEVEELKGIGVTVEIV